MRQSEEHMELETLKSNTSDKLCRFINFPLLYLSLNPKHMRGKAQHTLTQSQIISKYHSQKFKLFLSESNWKKKFFKTTSTELIWMKERTFHSVYWMAHKITDLHKECGLLLPSKESLWIGFWSLFPFSYHPGLNWPYPALQHTETIQQLPAFVSKHREVLQGEDGQSLIQPNTTVSMNQ